MCCGVLWCVVGCVLYFGVVGVGLSCKVFELWGWGVWAWMSVFFYRVGRTGVNKQTKQMTFYNLYRRILAQKGGKGYPKIKPNMKGKKKETNANN